jgi:hypothetical protein
MAETHRYCMCETPPRRGNIYLLITWIARTIRTVKLLGTACSGTMNSWIAECLAQFQEGSIAGWGRPGLDIISGKENA